MVELVDYASEYALDLPARLQAGDVFAVSAVLIGIYLAVLIINKLSGLIIFFLKKIFLLTIVSLAFYQFMTTLIDKVGVEGFTNDTIVFGVAGLIAGFLAFVIALYAAFTTLKPKGDEKTEQVDEKSRALMEMMSLKTLKDDKSIGAVLTYLVIAQFGVFSSKTIAAPNETVGMWFFAVFMVAAFAFIKQGYQDFRKGVSHFVLATVVGVILSVVLGHFWGGYELSILASTKYFASDSLVALVTGLAVSLFMGSKS
ncbi:MAG: hypothetical protein KKD39_04170 [Candidatus Altiarchaeota archaeon]|nr:hypothetical protein [Candidatus Altiarchaeota archaeon]